MLQRSRKRLVEQARCEDDKQIAFAAGKDGRIGLVGIAALMEILRPMILE